MRRVSLAADAAVRTTFKDEGEPMTNLTTRVEDLGDARLMVAIADAHAAADTASRIAADAAEWATRMGAGADDAYDASRCAVRARTTAARAERYATTDQAWSCARLAWAAVTSAQEANDRVNVAVAERLTVA